MITYAELNAVLSANLDDQFSAAYRPPIRIAAINSAVSRAMTAIGWALANRKGAEEALRELTRIKIFQTNAQGGINLNDPALGHGVWNVLGVYARPEVVEPSPAILPLNDNQSQVRNDLSWSGSGSPVRRVTLEEVPMIRNNSFRPGNEVFAANPKRVTFAYYIVGSAASDSFASGAQELRVLPQSQTGKKLIAVSYLKEPTVLVDETGVIEFPQSMKQTIADWTLQQLAWRQGDGTNLYGVAEKDAAQLFQFATQ